MRFGLTLTFAAILALGCPAAEVSTLLDQAGVKGGLVVHLGCADGKRTTDLRKNDSFMVFGLDRDAKNANITDGDNVKIESVQGKLKLKAKITDRVPEGAVFVSEDYEWVPVNSLRAHGYTNVRISRTK